MMNIMSSSRNFAIVTGLLGVVVGAATAYFLIQEKDAIIDAVDVVVMAEPLNVPNEFQGILEGLQVTRILLVGSDQKVSAIDTRGAPINLCEPGAPGGGRNCKLDITAGGLARELSGAASNCGRCSVLSVSKTCHKDTKKYDCHPGTSGHTACPYNKCQ